MTILWKDLLISCMKTPTEINGQIDRQIIEKAIVYFENIMLWIAWDNTLSKHWLPTAVLAGGVGEDVRVTQL